MCTEEESYTIFVANISLHARTDPLINSNFVISNSALESVEPEFSACKIMQQNEYVIKIKMSRYPQ
jgi:hypothetical protein